MEVAMPAMDFNFTPYRTAPTTPKRSGEYYFSAPNSPKQLYQFYRDYDDFSPTSSVTSIPFGWEERPGTPKSPARNAGPGDDFAFDVGNSRSENSTTIPAEELFDGGKIRQLKPPPGMGLTSPRSPRRGKEWDPFEKAVENTIKADPVRGRGRESSLSASGSRRGVRSESPYRVSKYPWEEEEGGEGEGEVEEAPKTSTSISSKGSSRKWRLRDFFLFRSASEGRAEDKDPVSRKYTRLFKKHEEEGKHSSFRSVDGPNSGAGSKKKGSDSAHEYYKVNKAAAEDLKKKSFLPYKQGILGRLAYNPIANGLGFSRK